MSDDRILSPVIDLIVAHIANGENPRERYEQFADATDVTNDALSLVQFVRDAVTSAMLGMAPRDVPKAQHMKLAESLLRERDSARSTLFFRVTDELNERGTLHQGTGRPRRSTPTEKRFEVRNASGQILHCEGTFHDPPAMMSEALASYYQFPHEDALRLAVVHGAEVSEPSGREE